MKRTDIFPFLFSLFFLVFVLRSINILGFPLYLDEGIYISWIELLSQSWEFAYASLSDGKTPLYIWAVSAIVSWFSSTLLAARVVSVVAGAVTAVSWAAISYVLFGKKHMWAYGVFALITPYLYFVERMAFVDSLVTAFVSLGFLAWVLAKKQLEKMKTIYNILWVLGLSAFSGATLALGYMTKTSARIFLVAQVVVGLVWCLEFLWKREWWKALLGGVITGLLVAVQHEVVGYMRVGAARYWSSIESKEAELAYPLAEIWLRLTENPLLYADSFISAIQFFAVYGLGTVALALMGLAFFYFERKSLKKNRMLFWSAACLLVYVLVLFWGSVLSGRVFASRYYYPIMPTVLSFATLATVWLYQHKNKWFKALLYSLVGITASASLFLVFAPLYYPYAGLERQFTRGDLSAVGLREIEQLVDPENSIVAITGIWGVKDGSAIYLRERGFEAIGLAEAMKPVAYLMPDDPSPVCPEKSAQVETTCWELNSEPLLVSERPNKYYFVTDKKGLPDKIHKHPGVEVVKEFVHPGGFKTYLLKLKTE